MDKVRWGNDYVMKPQKNTHTPYNVNKKRKLFVSRVERNGKIFFLNEMMEKSNRWGLKRKGNPRVFRLGSLRSRENFGNWWAKSFSAPFKKPLLPLTLSLRECVCLCRCVCVCWVSPFLTTLLPLPPFVGAVSRPQTRRRHSAAHVRPSRWASSSSSEPPLLSLSLCTLGTSSAPLFFFCNTPPPPSSSWASCSWLHITQPPNIIQLAIKRNNAISWPNKHREPFFWTRWNIISYNYSKSSPR